MAHTLGEGMSIGGGRRGGGGGFGPGADTTTAMGGSKKKHIKKPEDFIDAKDWDKFKRQEFLYYEEYENNFMTKSACIRFDLSFFIGGLLEKFTANFIDQIMGQTIPNWGTH